MKVAIVHYWLVGMRGGERVLEELVRLYPQADLFTHVADREKLSDLLANQKIVETFVSRLPGAKRHYQKYLGFMPRALEELDLSGYDLVISSESGPAKGVIGPPGNTAYLLHPLADAVHLGSLPAAQVAAGAPGPHVLFPALP